MVGKGNGSYLVLLDLSKEFDKIYNDTLFDILDKYVVITGSALHSLKIMFVRLVPARLFIDDDVSGVACV